VIYLLAFPSGEGGAGTATDEEKHLPADFDLSSKICKSILLLIHHYRGPPSLLGKALKEFDKPKFERDPIGRFAPSRMTALSFILTLSFWSAAIESRFNVSKPTDKLPQGGG